MTSYAQEKEDLILYSILHNVEYGNYIDVGANDPDFISVTKLFYELGWHGMNIEPLEDKYQRLVEKRPRDINLNIGIGKEHGVLKLHCLDTGSTFSDEIVEICNYQAYPTKDVEMFTLSEIVDNKFFRGIEIHFCKIDVEGFEKEVLLGIDDWDKFRPWVYCIESTIPATDIPCYDAWEYMLLEHGYKLVLAHGINRYYIDIEREQDLDLTGLKQFE